ncbi:MAG TPA: c-type cytochrome [Steroidobacteraceae bacterium]|nr:c-type cytochrome [Steroidobacteraceae bacterium]
MRPVPRIVGFAALLVVAALASRGPAYADAAPADSSKSPIEVEKETPKGKLMNPYKDTQSDIVSQGEGLFRSYACSGCHGGTGGGGMCPPLTNDIWVYGGDDDTLFRLVTLGSDALQAKGYTRKGHENVVGPMPPMGAIVKSADDLWKLITFIRAHYNGDPSYKFGAPASEQ